MIETFHNIAHVHSRSDIPNESTANSFEVGQIEPLRHIPPIDHDLWVVVCLQSDDNRFKTPSLLRHIQADPASDQVLEPVCALFKSLASATNCKHGVILEGLKPPSVEHLGDYLNVVDEALASNADAREAALDAALALLKLAPRSVLDDVFQNWTARVEVFSGDGLPPTGYLLALGITYHLYGIAGNVDSRQTSIHGIIQTSAQQTIEMECAALRCLAIGPLSSKCKSKCGFKALPYLSRRCLLAS